MKMNIYFAAYLIDLLDYPIIFIFVIPNNLKNSWANIRLQFAIKYWLNIVTIQ